MWRPPKINGQMNSRSSIPRRAARTSPFARICPDGYGSAATEIEFTAPASARRGLWICGPALKKVKPSLPSETQKKADAVSAALNTAIADGFEQRHESSSTLVETIRTMADAINQAVPAPETPEDKADKAEGKRRLLKPALPYYFGDFVCTA